jgi:hypothetical protein
MFYVFVQVQLQAREKTELATKVGVQRSDAMRGRPVVATLHALQHVIQLNVERMLSVPVVDSGSGSAAGSPAHVTHYLISLVCPEEGAGCWHGML